MLMLTTSNTYASSMSLCSIKKSEGGKMTTTCENSVFGGLYRAWKRSRLECMSWYRVVSIWWGGYFSSHHYMPCRLFIFTHPKPKQNWGHFNSWVISEDYWSVCALTPYFWLSKVYHSTTLCYILIFMQNDSSTVLMVLAIYFKFKFRAVKWNWFHFNHLGA